MDGLAFSKALEAVWELISRTNKYINESAPWRLSNDEAQRSRLGTILFTCAEVIRITTVLLTPILPESCSRVWKQLGIQEELNSQRLDRLTWGQRVVGAKLGQITAVFPRLEKHVILQRLFDQSNSKKERESDKRNKTEILVPQVKGKLAKSSKVIVPSEAQSTTITIDDFAKVDLRVGQVVSAEKVRGADRLLQLVVDIGTETRQILAGIAESYSTESLVGKKIVVVANLQSRKLRGLESCGMLLAASVGHEGTPVLATFLEEVPNGARLK